MAGNSIPYVGDKSLGTVFSMLHDVLDATIEHSEQKLNTEIAKKQDLLAESKSGNLVVFEGLQDGVPFNEVVVSGKNLLPSATEHTVNTGRGVLFHFNNDGTVDLSGTAAAGTGDYTDYVSKVPIKAGTYTLSGCPTNNPNNKFALRVGKGTGSTLVGRDYGAGYTFTFDTDDVLSITMQITENTDANGYVFKPQLELGSTATDYEPPITSREMQLRVSGKNLYDCSYLFGRTYLLTKTQGANNTIIFNGSNTSTGNAADYVVADIDKEFFIIPSVGTDIYLSNKVISTGNNTSAGAKNYAGYWEYRTADNKGVYVGGTNHPSGHIKISQEHIDAGVKYIAFLFWYTAGVVYDNHTVYCQIEYGTEATLYEPFKSRCVYTITPDTNPYTVPMDITQVDGTNVLSVDNGTITVEGNKKNSQLAKVYDAIDKSYENALTEIDRHTPQLLFSGVTSAENPAMVDLSGFEMILITAAYAGAIKYITSEYITISEIEDYISNQNRVVSSISNNTAISFYFSGSLDNCGIYSEYPLHIYGINQHTELKIYSQPEDMTCVENERFVCHVGAQGDGLNYQWQWRKNDTNPWANTQNKTATYATTAYSYVSGYQYRCIITDKYGNTVTSDIATMTVTE